MDEMQKMTFCVFMSHERRKPFLGHFYFHYGSLSIKCCCCEFLVNVFTKGLFLTSTTPTLLNLMAEFAVSLVLNIRLPASSRISMRNRFVYDGWIRF